MELFDAIKTAKAYVCSVYREDKIRDVLPEEVERSEDGMFWYITIGYSLPERAKTEHISPADLLSRHALMSGRPLERIYKVVAINDATGDVQSMKIRDFSQAS